MEEGTALSLARHSQNLRSNISNMRKSVLSGFPNAERWVGKKMYGQAFFTNFKVFETLFQVFDITCTLASQTH